MRNRKLSRIGLAALLPDAIAPTRRVGSSVFAVVLYLVVAATVQSALHAQQVSVGTPWRGGGSQFHEHIQIGFGFRHVTDDSLLFFQSGTQSPAAFGNFDLTQANTWGLLGQHGDWSWNLQFSASQGYNASRNTVVPSLTFADGSQGFIRQSTQRPFVSSVFPVVNGQSTAQTLFRQNMQQSAERYLRQQRENARQEHLQFARLQRDAAVRKETATQDRQTVSDPPLVLGRTQTTD